MKNNNLYFFGADDRIKIGISKHVARRLGDVSRTSGLVIELLGSIPGSYALEKFVHEKLSAHRLEGEWFEDCDEVRAMMVVLLTHGPDAIGFVEPPKKVIPLQLQRQRTPEEWVETDHKLLNILWSGDGYEQFAAFVEAPVDQVKRWFRGEERWPRVYRVAFAFLIGRQCMTDEAPPSYVSMDKDAV